MQTNGTISFEMRPANAASVNEYGEPIAPAASWSCAVECLIAANTDTRLGKYEDGEFHQATYTVLLDRVREVSAGRVRIQRNDIPLGEFRVMSAEPIPGMGRTRIIVE